MFYKNIDYEKQQQQNRGFFKNYSNCYDIYNSNVRIDSFGLTSSLQKWPKGRNSALS